MGKLHDLLYAMIQRINSAVKITQQTLTDAEKSQARANIGAMPSTYVPPDQTAQQVGADPKGTADAAVSAHNADTAAHADIRVTLGGKVDVADIVDNLSTADAKKPLSAKQGVELLKLMGSGSGGSGTGINLDSAKVGQLIVVESVDVDGKPVKWKAVDRTHYKEVVGEDVAVLPETAVRFTNSTATVSGFAAGAIKEGQTYLVSWNGTEYKCKAYLDDGIVHLGNGSMAGASVTTSDPFCIVGASATCMVFKNTEDTETITLKVDGVAEVVYHKIPAEYLPDNIGGGADWNAKEGEPGHVLNRTHYTESSSVEVPLHIEFDGNASGKETALVEGVTFVKVSNTVLTKDELVGATVLISAGGEEISVVLNAEDGSMQDMTADGIPLIANFEAFIAVQSDYTFEGSEFTAGLYFLSVEGAYTKSLSNPNVTVTEETETVHKLDPKYLPDGVPYCIDNGLVEVLPECQPPLDPGFGVPVLTQALNLIVGNTYTVNWNGVEYQSTAGEYIEDGVTFAFLGDLYTASNGRGGAAPTGEPFGILEYPAGLAVEAGFSCMIMPLDGSESVTLSIYQGGAEISKLDNRCLALEWLPVVNETEIFAETTVFGGARIEGLSSTQFNVGQTVVVYFDGVRYEAPVYEMETENGCLVIGDPTATDTTGDYPFNIVMYPAMALMICMGTQGHTLSIYSPAINKMPEEFLPGSVESVTLRSSTEGSTKLFKLTVDDAGVITATEVT